ncbi:Chaperone protein DnaK [Alloactinosynnema sp. L-07]|uniref:Hsp70 family protein n=1 Tax=Alloactinosynnema sp. L-07 TaxID=1653480 RepID=UPI00065EFD06|nr:Hsp70 family protein [Alloactinosynnema sp. L-07]CRK59397.1 Chaperone protein DnaK [Alloactinosynnema sp. L-07]
MPFHKVIGIDLGTTYSAVSIWDGKDTHIIESAFGTKTVPSVVGLDPEGQVIVGAPAQNNLASDPLNTIIEVKREMGSYAREPSGPGDPGEPRRVPFRGRDYLPQEISAFILMELKRQAESFVGEPIHDAVITVPAYFKEPQRGATHDAARMARLNVHQLLNEPTSAAVCFGADKVEDERTHTYAVYDLGGGTFDVSIIQISAGNVSVVGTGGDSRLGGGDFDDRITGWVLKYIQDKHSTDLTGDPAIWQRVKREAEMRKRELSVATAATLNLPYLTPTLSVNVPLTRATFEALIKDLLDQSLDCLDKAIESAHESNGVERDEIEQVLLVGGSTRIACVRPMLAEHLGLEIKDIRGDISPDEAVARGAGMIARQFPESDGYAGADMVITPAASGGEAVADGAILLQDVTSHTLGILANRADFVPILPKDSRIPGGQTRGDFTNGGNSKEIDVLIFQGENPVAFENDLIGKLPIILPEPKEQGYYRFDVTFEIDTNGLLDVGVKCLNDNQIWQTKVQCDVRATAEQIEASAALLSEAMPERRAVDTDAGLPVPPAGLPTPPGALPTPPSDLPRPPGAATPGPAAPPPPPASTPDEFKAIARRSFKLIGQLPPPDRARLVEAYTRFVEAVAAGGDDVEDLGDELSDLFYQLR